MCAATASPNTASRTRHARALRPELEACETRALLATVTLTSPGPITALTLADDGTFQVRRGDLVSGQVFPSEIAPGDAGLFVRTADGTVFGPNLTGRPRTAMDPTGAVALRPLELTRSSDGTTASFRADNANRPGSPQFTVSQVTTYRAGDEHFRVDTTLTNPGTTPLVLDVFAAADIYLASSDKGVGYYEPVSGAVGGEDRTGTYRIFVQPETGGGQVAPSAYQEGPFRAIWQTIGGGGHFDSTVLGPTGPAPYTNDPNYLDNGAGLQWRELTVAPGTQAKLAYYWSFGSERSVTPPATPTIEAQPVPDLQAFAGVAFTAPVATFTVTGDPGAIIATIAWGDGSTSTGTFGNDSQGRQQVVGTHTYATAGDRPVVVTLRSASGAQATATSTARVAVTGIAGSASDLTATAGVPFTASLVRLAVSGPIVPPSTAQIAWGDGTSGTGQVVAAPGGGYEVIGSHTYAQAGHFPFEVTVPNPGATQTWGASAHVTAAPVDPPTVQGGLDPASDSGVSNTDGITHVIRPAFQGVATPGAAIVLRTLPGPGIQPGSVLGTTTAGPDGRWRLVPEAALADGPYRLQVEASLAGQTTTQNLPTLVIDTQAPTVAGLTVDPRQGRLGLSFRDAGGGLDLATLGDLARYQFVRAVASGPLTYGLRLVGPATPGADGLATVGLQTASGRIGHGWRFQLWVRSDAASGVRDLAGNALDGEYRGRFPSGDGRPGGDFGIGVPTDGRKVLPYRVLPSGPARVAGAAWPRRGR